MAELTIDSKKDRLVIMFNTEVTITTEKIQAFVESVMLDNAPLDWALIHTSVRRGLLSQEAEQLVGVTLMEPPA